MFPELPTATKVLFPKVTPARLFAVAEVALSQDDPLSVDLTMFPEKPTATNIPEPEEEDDDELSEVLVELSVVVEVLSELVLSSSEESSESESVVVVSLVVVILSLVSSLKKGSSPQEMMVRLKRNMERMRSECFTWFPISGLRLTKIYQNLGDFTRMKGDCGGI